MDDVEYLEQTQAFSNVIGAQLPGDPAGYVEYKVDIAVAEVAGGVLTVNFYDKETGKHKYAYFTGGLGGACFGGSLVWGTAWMTSNIESFNNTEANFEINALPVATNVNWLSLDNKAIGYAAGGGFGVNVCVGGGRGRFKNA